MRKLGLRGVRRGVEEAADHGIGPVAGPAATW